MVINPAWSPDGARLVYHTREDGDPIFVADRNGANPRRIAIDQPGVHHHYPSGQLMATGSISYGAFKRPMSGTCGGLRLLAENRSA